jgi:16S rRNA (cytidine1402-2'-O)-methyltransferase
MQKNALYLIPVTLGDTPPELVIPAQAFQIIQELDEFIVENIRSARRFLRKAGYTKDFDEVTFHVLNKHTAYGSAATFVASIKTGNSVGLLSEAGVPCIADPGAEVVKFCHEESIQVIPLTGPSSIILGLMGSGFNGQNFAFHGYLPIDNSALIKQIKALESAILHQDQTQIFIETPYRNNRLFNALLSHCNPKLKLCIAVELTTENEVIATKTIKNWKNQTPDLHKKPAVFLLYK